jgi:hypothetical protein
MNNTALLDAFEAGEIAGNEFPHRSHVRVAWELSRRYGPEDGLRRLIAGHSRNRRSRGQAGRLSRDDHPVRTEPRSWLGIRGRA